MEHLLANFFNSIGQIKEVYTQVDFYQYIKGLGVPDLCRLLYRLHEILQIYQYAHGRYEKRNFEFPAPCRMPKGDTADMDTTWKWLVGGILAAAFCFLPITQGQAQASPIPFKSIRCPICTVRSTSTMRCTSIWPAGARLPPPWHRRPGEKRKMRTLPPQCQKNQVVACRAVSSGGPLLCRIPAPAGAGRHAPPQGQAGSEGGLSPQCLGCHRETGGPTGCQDCHVRTEVGDAFFHAGAYAPKAETGEGGHQ